ncbi:MAG: hypothetical protein GOU98_04370 [Candidatus Altiarchaeota archaeon]|nr:hypothetical protein [Candidatus Altiarchaeota archaeon]
MKRLILACLILSSAIAQSELNLYSNLDYGSSKVILEHRITVNESGYYIPEFDQTLFVSPYFEVQSVRRDDIVDMKYEVSNDYLVYTTRESIEYGEWYNTIITLKSSGNNPVIYGDKAYYFNPLISFVDNSSVSTPDGWTYLYNISNEKGEVKTLIYQLPRTSRFIVYNYSDYTLNFSEYENTLVRVSTNFWDGYTEVSNLFGIPLTKTAISSMPPKNFGQNTLAHFRLDEKVIEYNIDLSARGEGEATQTLLHEVVHALVDKKYEERWTCDWLSEGLPEYLAYSILDDTYNFTDDKKIMSDNLIACLCEDAPREPQFPSLEIPIYNCETCDRTRLPYDQGYLLLDNVSKTCDFFPCIKNVLLGTTCLDVTNTLAACCGDLSSAFDTYGINDYGVGQITLNQIYTASENCSEMGLSSIEIKTALKAALSQSNVDLVKDVPRKCIEFNELEKLADSTDKKTYLKDNYEIRGINYLKNNIVVYDEYLELKTQANNLRCFDKSILDTGILNVVTLLNSTIDDFEIKEQEFANNLVNISIITDNKLLREKAKTAWELCNFEELEKLKKQATTCEKIKSWGFVYYFINFFSRSCL